MKGELLEGETTFYLQVTGFGFLGKSLSVVTVITQVSVQHKRDPLQSCWVPVVNVLQTPGGLVGKSQAALATLQGRGSHQQWVTCQAP